jgi:hypothetical protein
LWHRGGHMPVIMKFTPRNQPKSLVGISLHMERSLWKDWIVHLCVIDLGQNLQAPNSLLLQQKSLLCDPPGQPHSILLSSVQDMKGFPITLASYKKSLQMAVPSESLENDLLFGPYGGRTASITSQFWSVHHTDHGAKGLRDSTIYQCCISYSLEHQDDLEPFLVDS